jgi:CYTH domain-containing protein
MNIETERKFLVLNDDYQAQAVKSYRIRQGYLAHDSGRTVRVRIRDDKGFLTIKGPSIIPGSRPEWEKEISLQEAEDLFALCKPGSVDKTRWIVPAGHAGGSTGSPTVMADPDRPSRFFEVDEFHGENDGLVMAEIELGSPDEPFENPSWLGKEVTDDERYYNGYLARKPFKTW